MPKKSLIITENDRLNILSMYDLLTEEVVSNVVITGKIIDKETNPVYATIALSKYEKNYVTTDDKGQFKITIPSVQEGEYVLKIKPEDPSLDFENVDLTITKNKNNYNLGLIKPSTKSQQIKEVKIGLQQLTNINLKVFYNEKPLNNYNLKITPMLNSDNVLFESNMNVYNPSLTFFKGGQVFEYLKDGEQYSLEKIKGTPNDFFFFEPGEEEKKNIRITISNNEAGSISKNFKINLNNATTKIQGDGINFTKGESKIELKEPKNEIVFELSKPTLELKIFDKVTGVGLPNTEVKISNTDQVFKTNDKGVLILNNLNTNKLNLNIKSKNYLGSFVKIKLDNGLNTKEVGLTKFNVGDELLDKYKDNLFNIYGRGRTDLNYDEALKIAKLDVVNKYLEKHKNRYKNVPKFENVNLDIKYDLMYNKQKKSDDDTTFVIIKSSKKDIRDFLRKYTEKENIEVESEPLVFEEGNIKEALGMAYRYGRNLFVIFGDKESDLTKEMLSKINKNKNLINQINKTSDLLFVDVSSSNYQILNDMVVKKGQDIQSQPKIIVLKGEDLNGENFKILYNKQYYRLKELLDSGEIINF
jgi:hypothetical protein